MQILEHVDEGVDHGITEQHHHSKVEKVGGEVGREPHVEHEVVDLVPGPAEDEAEGDESQSLDGVAPSLVPPVAWVGRGCSRHLKISCRC